MTVSAGGYVHNGKVVQSKPWSLYGIFAGLLNILTLFFSTLFTTRSMSDHTAEYNRSKKQPSWGKGGSLGGPKGNIHGFSKGAAAGCSGAGG